MTEFITIKAENSSPTSNPLHPIYMRITPAGTCTLKPPKNIKIHQTILYIVAFIYRVAYKYNNDGLYYHPHV